jgi:hypothetical protein
MRKPRHTVKANTVEWDDLRRMSVANSPKMPQDVTMGGKHYTWVGIGWHECNGGPRPQDPVVIDSADTRK